jgi:hypothetical protein
VVFAAAVDDGRALAIPLTRYRELRDSASFADAPACSEDGSPDESPVELGTLSLPAAPTTTTPVPCPAEQPDVAIESAEISPTGASTWRVDVRGTVVNTSGVDARAIDIAVELLAPADPSSLATALDESLPAGGSVAWSVVGEVTSPTEPQSDGVRLRWVWADVGLTLRCI